MIYFNDTLGLLHKKFPVQLLIEENPKNWGIGVLIDRTTFSTAKKFEVHYANLIQYLDARPDCPFVRVHCAWDALHSSRERMIGQKKLARYLSELQRLQDMYPHVEWFVSPQLEAACSDKRVIYARLNQIDRAMFEAAYSYYRGYKPRWDRIEKHGNTHGDACDIISSDGIAVWDFNTKAWIEINKASGALAIGAWIHSFNGRVKDETPPIYPKRIAWPTRKEFRRVKKVMGV